MSKQSNGLTRISRWSLVVTYSLTATGRAMVEKLIGGWVGCRTGRDVLIKRNTGYFLKMNHGHPTCGYYLYWLKNSVWLLPLCTADHESVMEVIYRKRSLECQHFEPADGHLCNQLDSPVVNRVIGETTCSSGYQSCAVRSQSVF
jgi:hypothetical protein